MIHHITSLLQLDSGVPYLQTEYMVALREDLSVPHRLGRAVDDDDVFVGKKK